ncbi:MAG: HD domain-containing protein, partial [Lachnospiraceae bacterium]|nr:HD domain-containing protein [Lachnospiraceae bacterium]
PVKNEKGKTACYVGADVSLDYMADYIKDFLVKVILILAGFFILIIYYSIWSTERYITYPISSMAVSVDHFSKAGEDQEVLDANVKEIRALDIHTGDEVEKLYQAICRMTLYQAEQMRSLRRLSESTAKMQDGLIVSMADMVESRDTDTGAHVQKTAAYVKIIVEGLKRKGYYAEKLTPKFISDVERSAPLHDVGKIHVSDKILNKPGPLTEDEFEAMKTHTTMGKKIMENAISTVQGENYLKEARNMAAYHHERWDGAGYPEGLHGEVIPLSARIMAVADVFDALTSPRVYKPAYPLEEALAIIEEGSGTQFDPKCVEVFMDSLTEVKVVLKKYNQV